LFIEELNIIVPDCLSTIVESSWNIGRILSNPQVFIRAPRSTFSPFIECLTANPVLSSVLASLEPIRSGNAAAVGTIAAEAAIVLIRKYDPPFIGSDYLLAGSGDFGDDGAAELIESAVDVVSAFPVVEWIVELLSAHSEVGCLRHGCLVETSVVGVVVDWWIFGLGLEGG
jgi:hypothetical protein